MNFFKKAKSEQTIDDTKVIMHDFSLRAPFALYRPVDYRGYAPLENFTPALDGYLDPFFAKEGAIDAGNKNICDEIVSDVASQAEKDLLRQRVEHLDMINAFFHRRCGDKADFEFQLKQLQEVLAHIDAEIQAIESQQKSASLRSGGKNRG